MLQCAKRLIKVYGFRLLPVIVVVMPIIIRLRVRVTMPMFTPFPPSIINIGCPLGQIGMTLGVEMMLMLLHPELTWFPTTVEENFRT